MDPRDYFVQHQTRRTFFKNTGLAAGRIALASLMFPGLFRAAAGTTRPAHAHPGLPGLPHFPPKARRLIYLFMNGAPSQIDLWDYKPRLSELFDTDLPESIRNGQRLTTMTSGQKRFPIAPTIYKFAPHGKCGTMVSELLPHTAQAVDDLAVIRSVYTEAINHDPASTYILTGNQVPGKPRIAQYEMAFRMQTSIPDLTDISGEPKSVLDLYGPEVTKPGTFAASALLARRLIERGVRVVQLLHREWDHHGDLPRDLPLQCR